MGKKRRRRKKSRARGDSFETLRLSRCAALPAQGSKEEEEEKRRNQNHLTPLSRPHTHTLDIYYLAPSSCEQLLAVAFVHPLPPPPAPAPPPARARVTMAARQFY